MATENEANVTPVTTDESLLTTESEATEESQDETVVDDATGAETTEENSEDESTTTETGDGDTAELDVDSFTVPEGMELDKALMEQAMPLFKEAGLNQTQAQKFIDIYSGKVADFQQQQVESFNTLKQDWANQAKSDPDIGGDKFDATISAGKHALDKFGTPELVKVLNDSGMGNHPEVIRFFASVGRLTQEDSPLGGANPVKTEKSTVDTLYPTKE